MRYEAVGTLSVELRPLAAVQEFSQPVQAGAHIDLHLTDGLVRSYSLINPGNAIAMWWRCHWTRPAVAVHALCMKNCGSGK